MDIKPPKNAQKQVILSTGKIIFLRKPKLRDQENAVGNATDETGKVNPLTLSKELVTCRILAVYRKNGEKIKYTDLEALSLLRDEGVFSYEEVIELLATVGEENQEVQKKGQIRAL